MALYRRAGVGCNGRCGTCHGVPGLTGLRRRRAMAIDFPAADLMDERACYDWLVSRLHPGGLA